MQCNRCGERLIEVDRYARRVPPDERAIRGSPGSWITFIATKCRDDASVPIGCRRHGRLPINRKGFVDRALRALRLRDSTTANA
jgi:hypothetical protein